jgi:hypothetical protein
MDLAHACRISTRHLSFLEGGRARPSRDMILHLGAGLYLSLPAQNELLQAAGFAPAFPASPLDSQTLAPFLAALRETMDRHSPYPALICDRRWRLIEANASALHLFSDLQGDSGESNLIRLLTDNERAAELVENLPHVLSELLSRLRLERLSSGGGSDTEDLVAQLEGALARHPPPDDARRSPLSPLILKTPAGRVSLLSLIAQFGTGEDVTIRDLRLELFFPADEATRSILSRLSADATPAG